VTTASTAKRPLSAQQVQKHMSAILALCKTDAQGSHQSLLARFEKGEHLAALKAGLAHGKWLPTLKKLRIDERTAQYLMRIAASPLPGQIRAIPRISLVELPIDLAVLDQLARLPIGAMKKALTAWPFAELTAAEIAKKAREVLGSKLKKSPNSKAQSGEADDVDADADSAGDDEETDEDKDADEQDDQRANDDAPKVEDSPEVEGAADAADDTAANYDVHDAEDPVAAIVARFQTIDSDLADEAAQAIESGAHSDEVLHEVTKALNACSRQIRRLHDAIAARRAAVVA
jgi:hypothetical protein